MRLVLVSEQMRRHHERRKFVQREKLPIALCKSALSKVCKPFGEF